MKPTSEATRLEGRDGFIEYAGNNKLKDMKAIITGGEYVLEFGLGSGRMEC